MSQWDKLVEDILNLDKNLRFEDFSKALIKIGYTRRQPKGGSSHYTFRKAGKMPVTLPKAAPMNRVYIEMVRDIIIDFESEGE